ncbi:KilA-N domain-containing protein [Nostoc sp. ChiVER01]|uniref:KilA-N domain-containing protein n=1 Tax=Nostoc sp. ChiVER01 TaxID=3075382 RepID=UPI002AD23853|nr:KilA-N domain-containing protein [Nostoc sp. ChiVER01]MDZ8227097.1 KilA-N domain-containing protein [Nostoc sp. ChiVER01]
MSQREQFDKLIQDARRGDGYINATEWCKHFGYRLNNWKQLPETKARLEQLKITESNAEPWIVERVGKTWVTWVHPIMAVHLASYLDPAFANYIAKIIVMCAKADPTLPASKLFFQTKVNQSKKQLRLRQELFNIFRTIRNLYVKFKHRAI